MFHLQSAMSNGGESLMAQGDRCPSWPADRHRESPIRCLNKCHCKNCPRPFLKTSFKAINLWGSTARIFIAPTFKPPVTSSYIRRFTIARFPCPQITVSPETNQSLTVDWIVDGLEFAL
jgi:hypothetical protein